jgi:hypothetical protein
VVYVVIKIMILDDPRTVLEHLPRTIPWAPLVFFTAFATSFQCDSQGRRGLRWQEGLVQGCVMAATAWTAYQISGIDAKMAATGFADDEVWAYVGGGGVLGFLIGVVVPYWYRADNRGGIVGSGSRQSDTSSPTGRGSLDGAGAMNLVRQA